MLLLFACGVLVAGCATTAIPTTEEVTGSYRWGVDPDNARYLVLQGDGSYQYSQVSTDPERFAPVPPFKSVEGTGRWQVADKEVVLSRGVDTGITHFRIYGRGAGLELHPVYGAGYVPAPGFRRITDEEGARHSLLKSTPDAAYNRYYSRFQTG